MPDKFLIVTGNPVDGFDFIGPFDDLDAANDYAENNYKNEEWWLTKMEQPVLSQ